jgi:hypothetical protein
MRPLPKKGYERSEVERLRGDVAKLMSKLKTAEEDAQKYKNDSDRLRSLVHENRTDARMYSSLREKELVIMEPGGGAKYLTGKDLDEYLEHPKITQEYLEKLLMEMSRSYLKPLKISVPEFKENEDGTNL